ncbi:MAG TPA: YqgE/AlgH family protein [Thermodesulfovibrionales bacterium]|nr:YqgE/AlgH family protein [Thermodesulfovibrionales bacterium]
MRIRKRSKFFLLVVGHVILIMLFAMPLTATVPAIQQEDFVPCRSLVNPPGPQRKQTIQVLSKGKFLVASKNMKDKRFAETVLLLVGYGPEGAMGLVINRPSEVKLSSAFPKIGKLKQSNDTIYIGGPVNIDMMFLLMRSKGIPDESTHVFEDTYVSSVDHTLRQIISSANAVERFRVFAGYAGWSPNQLDREVLRGDWHVVNADANTVFDRKSSDIWPELIQQSSKLWVLGHEDSPLKNLTCTNTDMPRFLAYRVSQDTTVCQD